jgi:3-phenylpropionate/trans-cinnamate dioxygenase ferredoxin subunit
LPLRRIDRKPFCDGTHSKIGFQAAEKAVPESAEG